MRRPLSFWLACLSNAFSTRAARCILWTNVSSREGWKRQTKHGLLFKLCSPSGVYRCSHQQIYKRLLWLMPLFKSTQHPGFKFVSVFLLPPIEGRRSSLLSSHSITGWLKPPSFLFELSKTRLADPQDISDVCFSLTRNGAPHQTSNLPSPSFQKTRLVTLHNANKATIQAYPMPQGSSSGLPAFRWGTVVCRSYIPNASNFSEIFQRPPISAKFLVSFLFSKIPDFLSQALLIPCALLVMFSINSLNNLVRGQFPIQASTKQISLLFVSEIIPIASMYIPCMVHWSTYIYQILPVKTTTM